MGRDLAEARPIDALEGGPGLEPTLLSELLALLFNDGLVLADGLEKQVDFESG